MRLYWKVKRNGKWHWVPAIYDMQVDRYDEIGGCQVLLWWPDAADSCVCKTCVPRTTDGEE